MVQSSSVSGASASFEPRPMVEQLANWALTQSFESAPLHVKQVLQNCLLYNLSMAFAVDERTDELGKALETIAASEGVARLIGGRGTRSPADAAFINASLITARGQNDTHPEVVTHIGCIVIPAVLALADQINAPLYKVLDALLVGYESIPRIAHAIAAGSTRRGFRASAIYGSLGASLACSVLLGLDSKRTQNAVSIATHTSSGLLQTWVDGSQEWRFQIAKSSRDGVHAALLAQAGISGSPYCLEGASGFAQAYGAAKPELNFAGWRLPDVTFKPYPGCAFNQAPVQALKDLMGAEEFDINRVKQIDIYMNSTDAAYPGVALHGPFGSASGAIMSAPFMLAATLLDGQPKVQHFEKQFGPSPVHVLSEKISVHAHESIKPWMCLIEVKMHDSSVRRLDFNKTNPFKLNWQQTQDLALSVSQEWPLEGQRVHFEKLKTSIEALVDPDCSSLATLQDAIYAWPRTDEGARA